MEWIFVLFLSTSGTPVMLEGFYPLQVENCQDRIKGAGPHFEDLVNRGQVKDAFYGCFSGSIEELEQMLKEHKFKPRVNGDPA